MLDDLNLKVPGASKLYSGVVECLKINEGFQKYYDRHSNLSVPEYHEALAKSSTLYIGNLSFFTRDEQIDAIFSQCGEVQMIQMGLNKKTKKPCGFCFVEYATRKEAELAVDLLNASILDQRMIRVDWDYGFQMGRQYGRGRNGGQVRDEFNTNVDKDRPKQFDRPKRDFVSED